MKELNFQEYLEALNADREKLRAENERLRKALTRLRDCDWTITLPDRMDAVREIAREALNND
jgi:cell division protein FtsB